MAEGHIKWYSEKKGYGFITSETEGDVFVHHKNVRDHGYFGLVKDLPVTFDLRETPDGKQAFNVRASKSS